MGEMFRGVKQEPLPERTAALFDALHVRQVDLDHETEKAEFLSLHWKHPLPQAVFKFLKAEATVSERNVAAIPLNKEKDANHRVKLCNYKAEFTFELSYRKAFRYFKLQDHLMHFLLERCRESVLAFDDLLVGSIALEDKSAVGIPPSVMKHEFLTYSRDDFIEKGSSTGEKKTYTGYDLYLRKHCLMCSKLIQL